MPCPHEIRIGGPDAEYKKRMFAEQDRRAREMYEAAFRNFRRTRMSVITKVYVQSCGQFPNGAQIRFNCVYDQDLAKATNEDLRFTRATPWGEATATMKEQLAEQSQWYFLFSHITNPPSFEGCAYALKVRCHVVHDYGTSKQIEISTAYNQEGVPEHLLISRDKTPAFHLKMTVDNPVASVQLTPTSEYWMTIYNAGRYPLDQVIQIARG